MKSPRDEGQAIAEFVGITPFLLMALVLLWEVFVVGMAMTLASHAANEGARKAAVTSSCSEIKKEAVARAFGMWADREHIRVKCPPPPPRPGEPPDPDFEYVRVSIRAPLLFPGVLLPFEVSSRSKVVPESLGVHVHG